MKKILFIIPVLLLFIPLQSFAQTPEAYHETVRKYCEVENTDWGYTDICYVTFEHVSGKSFTIDLKINDNSPVWLTLDSMCSNHSVQCSGGENHDEKTCVFYV